MGANAQTTVPTFTASQVLTADQQNQSARTGVPVFATTGTRDAGFGGTGEKTLAEGQLCYVEGTGLQTYNGTSWVTWGTAPATSALVVVKAETAFSAASSITADNVFTSTYRNYKLIINYTTSSTGNIRFRVRAGGSSVSTTTYNEQELLGFSSSTAASRGASATSVSVGRASNGSFSSSTEILICNPQIAIGTTLVATNVQNDGAYTSPISVLFTGNNSNATAYDGFELLLNLGNATGNYTLYGLATT